MKLIYAPENYPDAAVTAELTGARRRNVAYFEPRGDVESRAESVAVVAYESQAAQAEAIRGAYAAREIEVTVELVPDPKPEAQHKARKGSTGEAP